MNEEPPAARPNVLVVMFDQVAPTALGAYGNPVTHAPTLDRLAREGVVFDAAYSNSPLCTPARYCMMTGQLPSATRGYDNAAYLASTIPTFAHHARIAGYRTVLDGKMHFVGADQLHGFEERRTTDIYPADFGWTPDWLQPDERIDWWFHNMDSVTQAGVAEVTNQLLYDDEVGHQGVRALHDLARADDERPWLLVVSFTHPHDPYVTRGRYWDLYEGKQIPLPQITADDVALDPHTARLRKVSAMDEVQITDDDVRNARRAYYGNISYLDEWTARLTGTLDALGVADDTIVVLLADHGDMLGERGLWYKMNFFEGSARVPLVVHSPTRFQPKRVSAPVSLVDILPTITDLAGVEEPDGSRHPRGAVPAGAAGGPARRRARRGAGGGRRIHGRGGDRPDRHDPPRRPEVRPLPRRPRPALRPGGRPPRAGQPGRRRRLVGAGKEFRDRVDRDWDMDALFADVVADQARRRLVNAALRTGKVTPWDYTPPIDGSNEYMRNHLDLNVVEQTSRFPR